MSRVIRNDQVVSLAHAVARAALQVNVYGFDPRWIQSETKLIDEGEGVTRVRIRAEVVRVPCKPGGDWVTVSTTIRKKDDHTYFPGPEVKVDFFYYRRTYRVRVFEGAYRHLEGFEVEKEPV